MKQLFWGNIGLIGCFAFYLAWWIMGFNPVKPIRGAASAWLLIPAAVLGLLGLYSIVIGIGELSDTASLSLFSPFAAIITGIVAYVILLFITTRYFHRVVTTELLLIVAWTALICIEANSYLGIGALSSIVTGAFMVSALLAAAISIYCYLLFYRLEKAPAFVAGMIPLLLAELVLVALVAAVPSL